MATKKIESESVDALVLCSVSMGGNHYPAGAVLEGVPEVVAQANRHWLDAHPAAVKHARAAGADVINFED